MAPAVSPRRETTMTREEKTAKAAERRERFKELAKRIADIPPETRSAMAMESGIRTIEGRALSPVNCCLILTQCPGASVVGGFRQWLAAGRCVAKGQHGLSLWIPTKRKTTNEETGEESEKAGFVMGTVFDIGQTVPLEAGAPVEELAEV